MTGPQIEDVAQMDEIAKLVRYPVAVFPPYYSQLDVASRMRLPNWPFIPSSLPSTVIWTSLNKMKLTNRIPDLALILPPLLTARDR
jgi:hypothetical protein